MSYFITQPVYSKEKIKEVYEATKHLDTPLFIGIMPIEAITHFSYITKCLELKCQKMY